MVVGSLFSGAGGLDPEDPEKWTETVVAPTLNGFDGGETSRPSVAMAWARTRGAGD